MLDLALSIEARACLGAAAVFDPASLFTGGALGALYDPTDLSSLFQNSNGTTAVSANTDPVGYMADKSGNGKHATQPTAGSRPTLNIASAIKSLGFAGASAQVLFLPGSILTGWTSGTIVFAAKRAVDPPAAGVIGPVITGSGTSGQSNHYPYIDRAVYSDFLSNARKTAGDPGNMAAWHVGDFRSGANDWRAAFNSAEYFTTATNTVAAGVSPQIGPSFDGTIGRLIIINRVLSGAELAGARAWVAAGYGG